MIQLSGIKKSFHDLEILKSVDLTIEKGEVVVILGPSGSGKTTLLRSINCLNRADDGTVAIGDLRVDLKRPKKHEILALRRKTAMVFQHYNLFHNKTALQNISEALIMVKKLPKKEAEAIAAEYLRQVGLADKADRYPRQLSGGQQQRIGIARALAIDPELLLFDEPTSALDPELVGEVLDVMKAIAGQGRTMLIVTHEISFAKEIASRIVFMDGGVVVEEGPPEEILNRPQNPRTISFLRRLLPEDYSYTI
nr:amino acid ABC transporter ATP-binding protein [uncultured Enterocloster sp.]